MIYKVKDINTLTIGQYVKTVNKQLIIYCLFTLCHVTLLLGLLLGLPSIMTNYTIQNPFYRNIQTIYSILSIYRTRHLPKHP